jgi:hypothetical protein
MAFPHKPALGLGLTLAALWLAPLAAAPAPVSFLRQVAPVLQRRCLGCHGERLNMGGWRAHTFAGLQRPGASGAPAVTAGRPEASSLYRLLVHADAARRMPKGDAPLPGAEIALIRRWIAEGARFDGADPARPYRDAGPRVHPAAPVAYRAPVPALALALAPGGREVWVGGYHEVTVWEATTGRLLRRLGGRPQRVQALAFSPDGATLLTAGGTPGEYGEVALAPVAGGAPRVLETLPDLILAAAFSQDGRLVATGAADGGVRVYEAASGKRLWASRVHADWATAVSFSADGRFLASAGKDMTVKVYEVKDGSLFTTYGGHNRQIGQYRGQHPVYAVRFAPEPGGPAHSAGGGRWVQIWDPVKARSEGGDAADMEERFARQGHARYLEHGFRQEVFAMCHRGGRLFLGAGDGTVKQFDPATLKEARVFTGGTDWVFAVDYDPQSDRVAAGGYSGEVRVWNAGTGELLTRFRNQPGADTARIREERGPTAAAAR